MKVFNKDVLKNTKINLQFLPDFKEEKTQKFTTLVLTLITLSVFGIIAISPTVSTIVKLNKELDDSNAVDKQLSQKINNLTSLQQAYINLQKDLPVIFAAIPKTPDVPLFAAQVQSVATNSNILIDSMQTFEVDVNSAPTPRGFSSFTFALVVEGSYNDLSKFLDNLSIMQRIVSIDLLSLARKTGGNLQMTLKGETFFSP